MIYAVKTPVMQNKSLLSALFVLIFSWSVSVSCHAASDLSRLLGEGHKPQWEHMKAVSMIELIANPKKFDGKRVIVSGFVHFEFEGNALYFPEEDYRGGLRQNGVVLGVTPAQQKQYADCESKNCLVIGTFHAAPPGYFSLWSGHLSNITDIHTTITPTDIPTSSRFPAKSKSAKSAKSERTASQPTASKPSAAGSTP